MRILSFTAGAGQMLCGSCIRDNALARELGRRGHEVRLLPLYQRSRTDEASVSESAVRFGGVSVFLQHSAPLFGRLGFLGAVLDSGPVVEFAGRFSGSTEASRLGPLTLTTLLGDRGPARKAVEGLTRSLEGERFDLVLLPNSLLLGLAAPIKDVLRAPIVVTFSGEDLFLSQLPKRDAEAALGLMREAAQGVDHFVGVTPYHAGDMAERLGLGSSRVSVVRLGVDPAGFPEAPKPRGNGAADDSDAPVTVAYLSRIAPEKGLDRLAGAVAAVARGPDAPRLRVRAAGWMARGQRGYLARVRARFAAEAPGVDFAYVGSPDRDGKLRLLTDSDVFALPAVFPEPKGIPPIEAMMAGTPVVLPAAGAYPELIRRTGGGVLARSAAPEDFAPALDRLVRDPAERSRLGAEGHRRVREEHTARHMAEDLEAVWREALGRRRAA